MKRSVLAVLLVVVGGWWLWSTSAGIEARSARVGAALAGRVGSVRGVWAAERYELATGEGLAVEGRIVFGERSWQVLYFVLDAEGRPRRGSGEGGDYLTRGDTVVFRHALHLSAGDSMPGLAASPLRMEVRSAGEAAEEPTRFGVEGDRLTLFFPSGNRMVFRRVEGALPSGS